MDHLITHNGDRKQVLVKQANNNKTLYVGSLFEISYAGAATAAWKTYYMAGANRVAMRNASGLSWLYADHLGSTTCVVAAGSSSCAEQILYKAWGERRGASGNPATDYRYTGQREADAGLYFYQARWYDPALGRFAQADTIVPENLQGTQAWDRYAYSNNNPVNYIDPDGHSAKNSSNASIGGPLGWFAAFVTVVIVAATAFVVYEASLYHFATTPSTDCSLAQCFKENKRRVFNENEPISAKDFNELLKVTAQDIDKPFRTAGDWARGAYGTPFYDGGVNGNNKDVCIEGMGCYPQNSINYVAQGMYSAQAGESLEAALKRTTDWNITAYQHTPSPEKLYWTKYGYEYYLKYKNNKEQKQEQEQE